jgi:transmembrane sensor
MRQIERITYLLQQYASNTANGEEVEELFHWLRQGEQEDEAIKALLEQMASHTPADNRYDPAYWESVINEILNAALVVPSDRQLIRMKDRKLWWAAAAVLIIGVSTAVVVSLTNNRKVEQTFANGNKRSQNDVAPGGNKAILTLGNGSTIILDSAANGTLAQQGNVSVQKLSAGQLTYKTLNGKPVDISYNTLSTPKGGQYRLKLPDGTDVWLNASSSITYPTAFVGKDRKVTVAGEVYFEVAKDKAKPFHVKVDDMEVDVLGTHFNINAYSDEGSIKTTLLEGSVKVIGGTTAVAVSSDRQPGSNGTSDRQQSVVLSPGQQAQVDQKKIKIVNDADVEQVVAWKNGYFNFDKADLKTVMRQLSRWYDVEIVYEQGVPDLHFLGEIQRGLNLSDVLEGLKRADVHFRIEGKKIIVMP